MSANTRALAGARARSACVSTTRGRYFQRRPHGTAFALPSGQGSLQGVSAPTGASRSGLPTRLGLGGGTGGDATVAVAAAVVGSRTRQMRLLPLISDTVAIQAQTQRFEQLAGRSAMIGVLVALVAELLTEQSIFRTFSPDTASLLGSLFMGAVGLAAAAAAASKQRIGLDLLEAVVTSLTAAQRSAASVTGRQVDKAVDSVLNKAFSQGVICSLLAQEEDI